MKLVSRCLCLIGSLLAVPFVTSAAPAVEPFADGERVTFLGDSITHGGSYHVNLPLYWDLRHPGSRTRLMNCGVSGGSSTCTVRSRSSCAGRTATASAIRRTACIRARTDT